MYYIEQVVWNLKVLAKELKPMLYPNNYRRVSMQHNNNNNKKLSNHLEKGFVIIKDVSLLYILKLIICVYQSESQKETELTSGGSNENTSKGDYVNRCELLPKKINKE